jgi:hypothetical protein
VLKESLACFVVRAPDQSAYPANVAACINGVFRGAIAPY